MKKTNIVHGVEQTAKLAKEFAEMMKGGEVILLDGEMGAGKTTFAREFCRALNIEDDVVSPTFTIMREYDGKFKVYHFYMYRLGSGQEACEFRLNEYIYNNKPNAIVLIEWAENVMDILNGLFYHVKIERIDDVTRKITIDKVKIGG